MTKKFSIGIPCAILIFVLATFSFDLQSANATSQVNGKTLVLYDAASGVIPATQVMNFIDFPMGLAIPTYENLATVLDTTISGNETYAGWVSTASSISEFPLLDRAVSFQVNFSVQVERESHSNHNRSGFNVIILGNDSRGIELAFWESEIWVQNDDLTGGLFTHGETAAFNTTAGPVNYQLTIINDTYTLTANGLSILTGPVRDYTRFEGFPDPYQTPNFLFTGDNTTSAQARIRLSYLSITGTETAAPTNTTANAPTDTPTSTPTRIPTASPTPVPTDVGPCSLGVSTLLFLIFLNYFLAGNQR